MEQNLSWKKAYLVSALLHVVIAVIFAVGLAEIVAEKEQQMYVVDLATSNLSQGSGHEGGGGGAAAFPEPLKAEDVAKRVDGSAGADDHQDDRNAAAADDARDARASCRHECRPHRQHGEAGGRPRRSGGC